MSSLFTHTEILNLLTARFNALEERLTRIEFSLKIESLTPNCFDEIDIVIRARKGADIKFYRIDRLDDEDPKYVWLEELDLSDNTESRYTEQYETCYAREIIPLLEATLEDTRK